MTQYVHETPVFRPTKEEFSKPFSEYIAKVLKKYPDVAMFKVIPPDGWRPRRAPFPKLQKLDINCPIKQLVFGTRGSYRCMLVEQKPLTAYEFRDIAEEEARLPPNKERDKEDKLLERAFWSSLTINPPLYGADTPMSLFDEKLPYGWNLRDLGCLLKQPHIPQVPGVTTPMTYFGMWKSFFAWHVEDADLFSINYLHMGAPKVWYCVSPKDRGKFERMCQSMFPELHSHCHAFLRHKDILLSPSTLKNYGVEYMQAKQEPNEFIVLNAGAYHAGYNLGFNCAEAVNFATQEWVEVGRNVTRCKCDALNDGVRLSMRLFGCSSGSSASSDEEDESGSEDDDDESSDDESNDESNSEEEELESDEADSGSRGRRRSSSTAAAAAGSRRRSGSDAAAAETGQRSSKRAAAAAAAAAAARDSKRMRTEKGSASPPAPDVKKGPRQTKTSMAAAAAASKMRRTHATAEARARLAVQHDRAAKRGGSKPGSSGVKKASTAAVRKAKPARVINKADTLAESLQRAAAAAAAMRARAEAAAVAAAAAEDSSEQDVQSEQLMHEEEEQQQQQGVKQEQQQQLPQHHSQPPHQQQHSPTEAAECKQEPPAAAYLTNLEDACAAVASTPVQEPPAAATAAAPGVLTRRRSSGTNVGSAAAPDSPRASRAKLQSGGQLAAAAAVAACAAAGVPPPGEAPQVIIGEDRGNKHFYMVQVMSDAKPKQRGLLVMRWLKEGRDGLFRPSGDTWEEAAGALVGVRTQWVPGSNGKPGGYRLLTLRSRILDTELVD